MADPTAAELGSREAGDRELRRQLATLTYSQLTPAVPADAITAAGWWNLLGRLGFGAKLGAERLLLFAVRLRLGCRLGSRGRHEPDRPAADATHRTALRAKGGAVELVGRGAVWTSDQHGTFR